MKKTNFSGKGSKKTFGKKAIVRKNKRFANHKAGLHSHFTPVP